MVRPMLSDRCPVLSVHLCITLVHYDGQTVGWIKLPLGTKVGLNQVDFVLDGDPASLPTKGAEPPLQFSAHFHCGQTAGCIKMPLGMEVGLSPGDFGLDGHPAPPPPKREAEAWCRVPQFSTHDYCGRTAGWIKMALGKEVALVQSTLC